MRTVESVAIKENEFKEQAMKSILLKDYLEQRMYFIIILAVAIVSLLVAAFFKALDSGVALVMLFVLQGPFFTYLAANHQISSEINSGTFSFLASLPISRPRLWCAKLLFAFLYTTALYSVYVILAVLCGTSFTELSQLILASPAMTIGMPMLVLSFGYFTTMLPKGFSTISFLVLAPLIAIISLNKITFSTVNFELATVMLIVIFISLSAIVFMRDKPMNSPWRGVKGIALLIAGMGIFMVCWSALDTAADRVWTIDEQETIGWLPLEEGKTILWNVSTKPLWWDVSVLKNSMRLQAGCPPVTAFRDMFGETKDNRRLLLQNLETGKITPILNRNTMFNTDDPVFNQNFAAIYRGRSSGGFLWGGNYAVINKNGELIKDFKSYSDYYEQYYRYFKLIDERRFIYTEQIINGDAILTEFTLYEEGVGNRVLFTAQEDFTFSGYIVMPAKETGKPAFAAITGRMENEPDKLIMISVADSKKTVLPVKLFARPIVCGKDFIVFNEGRWNKAAQKRDDSLTIAWLDGRVEALDWIHQESQLAGVSADGRIIALIPDIAHLDSYKTVSESLVEIDIAARTAKELIRFPFAAVASVKLTKKADKALLYFSSHALETRVHKTMAIDLKNGQLNEFKAFNEYIDSENKTESVSIFSNLFFLSDNRFMVETADGIYELDVASVKAERKLHMANIGKQLQKGGASQ